MKNKVAPPFRVAEFDMMHTNGISYEGDILDLALAQKIIARSGAWFKYGEAYLGQGKEKARALLEGKSAVLPRSCAKRSWPSASWSCGRRQRRRKPAKSDVEQVDSRAWTDVACASAALRACDATMVRIEIRRLRDLRCRDRAVIGSLR